MANMDLDTPLDDIIKRNSSKSRGAKRPTAASSSSAPMRRSNERVQRATGRGGLSARNTTTTTSGNGGGKQRPAVNSRVGSVRPRGGGVQRGSRSINARLGGIIKPQRGPVARHNPIARNADIVIKRNTPQYTSHKKIDPASIIITKPLANRTTQVKKTASGQESIVIQSKVPTARQPKDEQKGGGNRGGRGKSSQPQQEPQQQETALPLAMSKNIVLVCNLDPRATAEDVGEACSMFGPILSCDMLVDPMGRPLNEAEIEFMHADSARECVARLDNTMADGRLLRAKLQDAPTMPVKPRYSSRAVVASARVAGGLDNQSPMARQQPSQFQQPTYPVYSPQPYYQQQPYYQNQQYQRRY